MPPRLRRGTAQSHAARLRTSPGTPPSPRRGTGSRKVLERTAPGKIHRKCVRALVGPLIVLYKGSSCPPRGCGQGADGVAFCGFPRTRAGPNHVRKYRGSPRIPQDPPRIPQRIPPEDRPGRRPPWPLRGFPKFRNSEIPAFQPAQVADSRFQHAKSSLVQSQPSRLEPSNCPSLGDCQF